MIKKQSMSNPQISEKDIYMAGKYDKIECMNLDNRIKSYDEMPLFLDAYEVSRTLGIGRNSTYELFKSYGFPTIAIKGQFRVRKDDLMKWLDNQKSSKEVDFIGKKK